MYYKIETLADYGEITVTSAQVYSYPAHIHTYSEMILYEPFDGEIVINDRHIAADSCSLVLIVPSNLHRVVVKESAGARFIKTEMTTLQAEASVVLRGIGQDDFLKRLLEELLHSGGDSQYRRLLADVAVHALLKRGERIAPLTDSASNQLVLQAMKLISQQFRREVTLEEIAQKVFVSPPHLSRVFKRTVGVGFSRFLSELRLNYAAQLLRNTSSSVSEICFESGYRNLSHFIREFGKRYGCAPSEYRKMEKES